MWQTTRPIYVQIRDLIAAAIIDGQYGVGDSLPSVRALAAEQQVNPLTVSKAYQELQSGQLQAVLENFAAAPLPVQLYYREGRRAAGRVRSFLDFAVPRLRAHPAFQA